MKKILMVALLFAIASYSRSFARNNIIETSVSPVLSSYYEIKNALVGSDQQLAAQKANEMVSAIAALPTAPLAKKEAKLVEELQIKLSADAKTLANGKDLLAQRTAFSSLSQNVYALAKVMKLSSQAVYYDFCPMKKTYWLSSEAAIKNPYFGNPMLTCGSVKETLNP